MEKVLAKLAKPSHLRIGIREMFEIPFHPNDHGGSRRLVYRFHGSARIGGIPFRFDDIHISLLVDWRMEKWLWPRLGV